MHLSYLREYVALTRYMNISKASRELHMTQSNLSKHIRQIELEVGADLVSHGNRLEFTPAGLYFLDQANKVVDLFDGISSKCREIETADIDPLVIRQPTFNDAGTLEFYRILDRFRSRYADVPVRFTLVRYASPSAMIRAESVDAHVIYEFGDVARIAGDYAERGFLAYPLCSEKFGVWLDESHHLAKQDAIEVEDLKGLPVLESNQTFAPLAAAISGLCRSRGFDPTFEFRTINSFAEMITYGASKAVRVFPMSVKDDPQLKMNQGMRLVPLADGTEIQAMLLMDASSKRKKAAALLQNMLEGLDRGMDAASR